MMDFRDELLFLAYTVAQEAQGESPNGQLGVACVVMNRTKIENLSVTDVIFKSMQFSCWNADSPTRMHLDTLSSDVLKEAYKYACIVYFGLGVDPSRGATHYLNEEVTRKLRGGSLPSWFDEAKVTVRLGNHTFLKLE